MCDINKNMLSEIKTGYKVLARIDDKLYSSFTGELYTTGPVPLPPERCNRLGSWNDDLNYKALRLQAFYNEEYVGYSGAYERLVDAYYIRNVLRMSTPLIIAKITFSGDVFCGRHLNASVIAGNYVESIEIVEE